MGYFQVGLESFILNMMDLSWEPAADVYVYAEHFLALNKIVRDSGEVIEGGLFNRNLELAEEDVPLDMMHGKLTRTPARASNI